MSDQFTFRFAQPEDCPLILTFIQALADYEHLSHQVVATPSCCRSGSLKSARRRCSSSVTGEGGGLCLVLPQLPPPSWAGRGIYLEDLFVLPEHRGKGCGSALLRQLARITKERGCGRLEWSCLDWNQPSIRFYRSLGAQPMDEWTTYRLTGETLDRMADACP